MDREEIKGKGDQLKGDVKKAVGRATGDERLEDEGTADKVEGHVREGLGTVKRKANDALDEVDDAFER